MKAGKKFLGLVLTAAVTMAAADAMAQFRGGIPGGGMPGGGSRGSRDGQGGYNRDQRQGGERPAAQEDPASVSEYRLDLLRMDLKLAPDQESSWKAFADKVIALATDILRERNRAQATLQMKSMQRIDQSVDVARDRLTALEDIAAAAKTLYAHLTPEQQALADARLATTLPIGPARPANAPATRDRPPPQ
jgi:protein CpxP